MAILSLASCEKKGHEPEIADGTSVMTYDGEAALLRKFMRVDSKGNVTQHIIGMPLNESDQSVISYAMSDLNAAREEFLSFLPEDAKVERKDDGSIIYTPVMTEMRFKQSDKEGEDPVTVVCYSTDMPTVVFTPVEKGNLLATITFNDASLPVKRAEILYNWPVNSDSKYCEGDGVPMPTLFERDPAHYQKMVCIRESGNGRAGVLLYLSPETRKCGSYLFPRDEKHRNGMIIDGDQNEMPDLGEMKEYWGIINSNLARWQRNFVEAGNRKPVYGDKCWFGKKEAWNWYTVQCRTDKKLETEAYSREKNWDKPFWNVKYF